MVYKGSFQVSMDDVTLTVWMTGEYPALVPYFLLRYSRYPTSMINNAMLHHDLLDYAVPPPLPRLDSGTLVPCLCLSPSVEVRISAAPCWHLPPLGPASAAVTVARPRCPRTRLPGLGSPPFQAAQTRTLHRRYAI